VFDKRKKPNEMGVLTVEGLTPEQIRKEAEELYRAEKNKGALRPFTEKYPKIAPEESYRIQLAVIEVKKSDGAKVVGKKIGLTSKAMQKMLNVDQPDYGHILDNMVLDARDILVELGKRKVVGGQEDMIEEVAMMLADK
jgi:2-keto-4-pentenoate hydratase